MFNDMPLSGSTKQAVAQMGYTHPTPIQKDAIPHLLQGKDLIGRAQTGTGKTAAFGIPMIEALTDTCETGVLALIMVPTRELATQVAGVLQDIAKQSKLRVEAVFGGVGFAQQKRVLTRDWPVILVACPGRLLDLMGQGVADLSNVKHLVLDEADRMLDMGFIHDIKRIMAALPRKRQTMLFSATLDTRVRKLAAAMMDDPVTVEVDDPKATPLTDQYHTRVEKKDKADTLVSLLHDEMPDRAVVFTRTKHLAKRLADRLDKQGWSSVALQGNMSQNQRDKAMESFKGGRARIMVATDVAARGLDIDNITHVINLDLPQEPEAYVHRVGRTGRNGKTGRSFTFVQSDQVKDFKIIKDLAGTQIPHKDILVEDRGNGPDPAGSNRPQKGPQNNGPQGGRGARKRPQQRQGGHNRAPKQEAGERDSRGQGRGQGSHGRRQGGRGPRRSGGGGGGRSEGSDAPRRFQGKNPYADRVRP